jgi:hypothetical protein
MSNTTIPGFYGKIYEIQIYQKDGKYRVNVKPPGCWWYYPSPFNGVDDYTITYDILPLFEPYILTYDERFSPTPTVNKIHGDEHLKRVKIVSEGHQKYAIEVMTAGKSQYRYLKSVFSGDVHSDLKLLEPYLLIQDDREPSETTY